MTGLVHVHSYLDLGDWLVGSGNFSTTFCHISRFQGIGVGGGYKVD